MMKVNKKHLRLYTIFKEFFIVLEMKSYLLSAVSKQFYADDENNQRLYIVFLEIIPTSNHQFLIL